LDEGAVKLDMMLNIADLRTLNALLAVDDTGATRCGATATATILLHFENGIPGVVTVSQVSAGRKNRLFYDRRPLRNAAMRGYRVQRKRRHMGHDPLKTCFSTPWKVIFFP
jgi:predicted dehydrogenase